MLTTIKQRSSPLWQDYEFGIGADGHTDKHFFLSDREIRELAMQSRNSCTTFMPDVNPIMLIEQCLSDNLNKLRIKDWFSTGDRTKAVLQVDMGEKIGYGYRYAKGVLTPFDCTALTVCLKSGHIKPIVLTAFPSEAGQSPFKLT